MAGDPLLDVRGLSTHFHTEEGTVRAVDGLSFAVEAGQTLCLVGESGSGKTVAAESITGLIESPPGEVVAGEVVFDGRDLTSLPDSALREVRGDRIAHVFQHPQDALNPVYRVGRQIAEVAAIHGDGDRRAGRRRAIELLARVGIPDPATRVDSYPHELSGGMKQRVVLAVALAGDPDLLIADEPTTALDVTIQADILALLTELQAELGLAVLYITHDLGVVARVADEVVVMYAGKAMERGPVEAIFDAPGHPYTRGLLACLPGRGRPLASIGGSLPSPIDPPGGCRFADRCPYAVEACRDGGQPALEPVGDDPDHVASCRFHAPGADETHLETPVDWSADPSDRTDAGAGGERR